MITIQKVIDSINDILYALYPTYMCYIQDIPKDFERPSFFIQFVTDGSTDMSRAVTEEEITIEVVYFAPVNDFQIAEKTDALSMYQRVKDIFRKGFIPVEDRAVKVSGLNGETRGNEIYLVIDFTYFEDRPQEAENYQTMQDLQIRQGRV